MKESTLQIQCVEYLTILAQRWPDLVFFSIPNEGLMMVLRAFKFPEKIIAAIIKHFKKMGMLSGIPDFCILYNNKCHFIEFKREGKKPSIKQKRIHDKIADAGFMVWTVDNFETFKKLVDLRLLIC